MVRPAAQAKDVMSFGPFSLVASERLLTKDGVPVELSARAFDTLVILLSRPKDARPEEGRGTPLPTYRGSTRSSSGPRGRNVNRCCGQTVWPGASATLKLLMMVASTCVASCSANPAPMHMRGPMPNGR
jgi:hypothetical protein